MKNGISSYCQCTELYDKEIAEECLKRLAQSHTYLTVTFGFQCLQCSNVANCEINDMDIVPDACAICSVIIITIDIEIRSAANGHLCYIRHQIVWWALWIFANTSRLVGANRIEVSQQNSIPGLSIIKNYPSKFCV